MRGHGAGRCRVIGDQDIAFLVVRDRFDRGVHRRPDEDGDTDVQRGREDLAARTHQYRSEIGGLLDEDGMAGALNGLAHLADDGLEAILHDFQQHVIDGHEHRPPQPGSRRNRLRRSNQA